MSKREEDFIEAGIQYRFAHGTPMAIGGGHFAEMTKEMNRTKPFEAGAEHGYQYAIEKACEVIARLYPEAAAYYEQPETFVEQIRKAMEEWL